MARPISEEKPIAILNAAAQIIAERGIGAPTSRIAKQAGVAEGTVFKYFTSKEQLFNQVYLELKREVAGALLSNYPSGGDLREKAHHIWTAYLDWAVQNAAKRNAIKQLGVSSFLTDETRQNTHEILSEVEVLLRSLATEENGLSSEFIAAVMTSLAETTVDFMLNNPADADDFSYAGFRAFWRAVNVG